MKTTFHTFTQRALLLALLAAAALHASAYDFKEGRLYYNKIEYNGNHTDYVSVTYGPTKYKGDIEIPKYIRYTMFVIMIDEDAFRDCINLHSIVMSDYVMHISNHAFSGCTGLTSLDMPAKVLGPSAFEGCVKLETIRIANTVNEIGNSAFKDCGAKRIEIRLGENMLSIGEKAFMGCNNLDTIKLLGSKPPIVEDISAFDDIHYNNTVVLVSQNAINKYYKNIIWSRFDNIQALDYDTEQDGVCFKKTSASTVSVVNITEAANVNGVVSIPSTIVYDGKPMSVASIGKNAFRSCNGITQVNCPATLKEIGEGAFRDCIDLKKVYFPDSITHIGKCAFANCTSLVNSGGKGVIEVGDSAFAGCSQIQYPAFANNIRRIGNNAYENCTLYNFRFNGILEIGENAFKGSTIKNLYLPSSLQKIGNGAYRDCNSLKTVVFEQRLSPIELGEKVFAGCGNLKTIVSHSTIPPQLIGTNIFESSQNQQIQIVVPHSSVNSYRASDVWSCFSNYSAMSIDFCINSIN